jgi:putative NADH-flavin reductase
MKTVLLGATGKVGAPIRDELLDRGHQVTAVVRDASRLPEQTADLRHCPGDVFDAKLLGEVIAGVDAVICSVALRDPEQQQRSPVDMLAGVARVAAGQGVRLVTMGGAGSLRNSAGVDLVDTPQFPDAAKPESLGFRDALHWLRSEAPAELSWSMLSPPISIEVDSPRTGSYRTSDDDLIVDEQGASRISAADLAVAMVDEVENGKHERARFAAAY